VHSEVQDSFDLGAIVNPAMILAPCALLGITQKVWAGNMMMMAHLTPSQPRKEAFGAIGMHHLRYGIGFGVVDPGYVKPSMQIIPGRRFIGHQVTALHNP
jgi:hypothetical protein